MTWCHVEHWDTSFVRSVSATGVIRFSHIYICHFGCSCFSIVIIIAISVAHTLLIEGKSDV